MDKLDAGAIKGVAIRFDGYEVHDFALLRSCASVDLPGLDGRGLCTYGSQDIELDAKAEHGADGIKITVKATYPKIGVI